MPEQKKRGCAFTLLVWFCLCAMLAALLFSFKTPLLRSLSDFLIRQDQPAQADAMVVLSGNAFDRGNEGARLFQAGYTRHVICPGGNLERLFLIVHDTLYESDLLRLNILRNGVPDTAVTVIREGTSTIEEADAVLRYCQQMGYHHIIVVTSLFHTRRASAVYRLKFKNTGISVIVRGAHDSSYSESEWWKSEYGLIALNNEYMKTIYYLLKGEK